MRRKDVPQDRGILGEWKEIHYAVDDDGRYVLVPTAGWEPKNDANRMAWESIDEEVRSVLAKVRSGELSPLAYHMARHQMDPGMLAGYVGCFRWQVRRHMQPEAFRRIPRTLAMRYASVFRLSPEELARVPEIEPAAETRK